MVGAHEVGEGVVLEDPQFSGVSPGAGYGLEGSPAHGEGKPRKLGPQVWGSGELGQAALVTAGAWGDLRHRGAR